MRPADPNIHDNVNVASHQIGRDAFHDMMMIPHMAEGDGLHTSAAVRPRTCATTPTYVSLSVYAYFTRCCSRLLFSPPHQPQRKPATHRLSLTRSELVCIHQRSPVDSICICVCRTAVAVVQQLGGSISIRFHRMGCMLRVLLRSASRPGSRPLEELLKFGIQSI